LSLGALSETRESDIKVSSADRRNGYQTEEEEHTWQSVQQNVQPDGSNKYKGLAKND
jgi:hypothetical protein